MANDTTSELRRDLAGTLLAGRYRLESKLGSGGMSTVYLARDETLERWVAIKLMHREISDQPDQLERFRREARAVAQLSHPNVVAVIDAGEDEGFPFIVFEYVSGETLKARIDRAGRLPLDEAAAYAIEIGRGLAAAHTHKLVHRDVKPQNVLIDPEGRAKVTDFGIARSLESDGLTKTGRVLGTTDYVSPEQAMGHGVDSRSDVYSLGVLLYEMLTGQPPFKAETVVGVAMKHVNDPMPDVQELRPDASAALARVVEKATQKDARRRYADMNAMLADLEGALEVEVARSGTAGSEATNVLESVPQRRKILTSRRASIAGVLLVLLATAAALVIAAVTGGGGSPRTGGGSGAVASGANIAIQRATAFDPEGSPPGEENNDQTTAAIDGDPTTTGWSTETYYSSPTLSVDGKSGVGLYLSTSTPVAARTITIDSETAGWVATVYGAVSGPPAQAPPGGGWHSLVSGPITIDRSSQQIQLDQSIDSQYYLIWITKLASGSGGYSVQINDVKLTS
jgi:serine/threonine protein kinase